MSFTAAHHLINVALYDIVSGIASIQHMALGSEGETNFKHLVEFIFGAKTIKESEEQPMEGIRSCKISTITIASQKPHKYNGR